MSSSNEQKMLAKMKKGHEEEYDWGTFPLLRRMRDVRRLSGFYLTRPYSDAEHCYYTGLLFLKMARDHAVALSPSSIAWVFCHDAMEVATGDLLYPVKNASKDSREAWDIIEEEAGLAFPKMAEFTDARGKELLGEKAWALFKACDSLELWLFCREEAERGNVLRNIDGSTVEDTMFALIERCEFEGLRSAIGCR